MPRISSKLIIGTASTGAIGGVGYLVSALVNNTENLDSYLSRNGLSRRNDNWDTVAKAYVLAVEDDPELSINNDTFIRDGNFIKEWCNKNLDENIKSTDPKFKATTWWCVNYETIENKFKNRFETDPKQLTAKYRTLPNNIKELVDYQHVENNADENANGQRIQKWCDLNKIRRFSEDDKIYSKNIPTICLKADASA